MKKIVKAISLCILAFGLMPSTSVAQLRYNLGIGQKYGLKQATEQDITQSIQGMTQSIKNTMGGNIVVTIKAKEGRVYTSEFVFETLVFKMQSDAFSMAYDSTDEEAEENMMTKGFKAVVGFPFSVKFTDKGEIIEVKGFDQLAEKVARANGGQGGGAIAESLKGQFSNENMKQSLGSMLIIYPDEKIKPGYTWDTAIENKGMMANVTQIQYEVAEVSGTMVMINGKGTMKTQSDQKIEQNGMAQSFDLNGNFTIKATVDAQTGWPLSVNQDSKIEGNVVMESPQLPKPMEIPMSIDMKTSFTKL